MASIFRAVDMRLNTCTAYGRSVTSRESAWNLR